MSTMALDASSERREQMRRTVIKGARIVFNERKSTLDCRVRDMTQDGARLDFSTPQLLPHEFELQLAGVPARRCGLCWARGTFVGVRFLDAA
jgi:hypothetical protein